MNMAQMSHTAVPRTTPGTLSRVNEITVLAAGPVLAASAKPTPTRSCRTILPRLFSPRLRWRRTFSQSSANPIAPAATSANMTKPPAQVNRALLPRCPRRYPAPAAMMIVNPPIVGVPSFTMWMAGPSRRTCWPIRRSASARNRIGVPKPDTNKATVPAMKIAIISPPRPRPARAASPTAGSPGRSSRARRARPPGRRIAGSRRRTAGSSRVPCPPRRRCHRVTRHAARRRWRSAGSARRRPSRVPPSRHGSPR